MQRAAPRTLDRPRCSCSPGARGALLSGLLRPWWYFAPRSSPPAARRSGQQPGDPGRVFHQWRAFVSLLPRDFTSSSTTLRCVDDGPMLIIEDRDDVAVLRIEHGRVGALDVELLDALTEAVTASDRALVITGSGSSFSAGVDLRRILDGGRSYTEELLNIGRAHV